MLRFSLKSYLLAFAVFGLLLASLRFAAPVLARALFLSVLCFLAFGVLLALYARPSRLAFWRGFAIFGWIMVGVTQFHVLFAEGINVGAASVKWDFHPLAQQNLPTTAASRGLYRLLQPGLTIPIPPPPPPGWHTDGRHLRQAFVSQSDAISEAPDGTLLASGPGPYYVIEDDFLAAADCWWILLTGAVGGMTASWLARRRDREAKVVVDA